MRVREGAMSDQGGYGQPGGGQYGGGPGPYGGQPPAPYGGYQPYPGQNDLGVYGVGPSGGGRPAKVTVLSILAIIFGGLGILGGVGLLILSGISEITDELERQTTMGAGVLRLLGAWALLAGIGEIVGGIFALQGRNWARLLLTAILGIGVLVNVFSVVKGQSAAQSVPSVGVSIAVIVLLWMKDSSEWFARGGRPVLPGGYPGQPPTGGYSGQPPYGGR